MEHSFANDIYPQSMDTTRRTDGPGPYSNSDRIYGHPDGLRPTPLYSYHEVQDCHNDFCSPGEVIYSELMGPYVEIIEQPASYSLRFRYECEIDGRSAGSLYGANSTAKDKSFPKIRVMNYVGPYAVVVSCVTKDKPYRPHPHQLVGKEHCKRGVFSKLVDTPDMTYSFTNLGIQCVKKKEIEKSLKIREADRIDPFGTGFNNLDGIDLNVLRLCFQVFIPGPDNCFTKPIKAVVSVPIYDKKAISDLTIVRLSHYSAPVTGGTEVILLCDRVAKDDTQIWFYEKQDQNILWESEAKFRPVDVHKQVAICFKTPPYHDENIQHEVNVFVELRKPSENKRGERRPFLFLTAEGRPRKRTKPDIDRYIQSEVLPGFDVQGRQIRLAVPRLTRPSYLMAKTEYDANVIEPCPEHQTPFSLTTAPVPDMDSSTSSHFTPTLAVSPHALSLVSVTQTLATTPVLAASSDTLSVTPSTAITPALASPTCSLSQAPHLATELPYNMQQGLQQPPTPFNVEINCVEEEIPTDKDNSMFLVSESFKMCLNLSESMFDSSTSITQILLSSMSH